MAEITVGDRVGRTGEIRSGVAAFIRSDDGRILLTRRTDNGRWCLPGGHVDPGESVAEACVREVQEETGLEVVVTRMIGVYSSPDFLVTYPDGNRAQFVSICLGAEVVSGEPALSDETTQVGYYTLEEVHAMDVMETHHQRIEDGVLEREAAFVR
jgi:ADP-ribose pyrophosphatase YjhB (NUDIX family)